MRSNPVKEKLERNERVFGTMAFELFAPGLPQIVASTGAEFLLYDMEHSGASLETMKAQFAACRGIGIVPMARVPATEYHFIARLLDVGAMGVMVPMVESRAQAEAIVSCTRYPPLGRRGSAFGVAAHDDYLDGKAVDKIAAAHRRTLVICLIETARGIENVDAIAAVPGVDVLWLGHSDLTNFMGIPGEFDHPRYLEAVDAIVAAARRHGKRAGFQARNEAWGRDYLAKGFDIVAFASDILAVQAALRQGLAAMREAAASPASPVTTGG